MASAPVFGTIESSLWLRVAAQHGVPAVVPVSLDGEHGMLGGAVVWGDKSLRKLAKSSDPVLRVILSLEACRRMYAEAGSMGCEVTIP